MKKPTEADLMKLAKKNVTELLDSTKESAVKLMEKALVAQIGLDIDKAADWFEGYLKEKGIDWTKDDRHNFFQAMTDETYDSDL